MITRCNKADTCTALERPWCPHAQAHVYEPLCKCECRADKEAECKEVEQR